MNGVYYHVDSNGKHFRLSETVSGEVGNYFSEPYSTLTGLRIPKPISGVPQGTVREYRVGAKTHAVLADGTEMFPTWVSAPGDRMLHLVWVSVVPEAQPEPTPIQQKPYEETHPVQPNPGEYSPPALPILPAPTPDGGSSRDSGGGTDTERSVPPIYDSSVARIGRLN